MEKQRNKKLSNGFALIMAMIFLAVFAALGVSMASMSSSNVQIAKNQHEANKALVNALSGLEFVRKNFEGLDITWPDRLTGLEPVLQSRLAGMTGVDVSIDDADGLLKITDVMLDSQSNQRFSVSIGYFIDYDDNMMEKLRVDVLGKNGDIYKSVQADYRFRDGGHSVFDFAVATKGPLSMVGQAEIDGTATDEALVIVQASVYIEGVPGNDGDSFAITNNASVAGQVDIYDPNASYDIGNKAVVGGGAPGSDEMVDVGVEFVEFPLPYPETFEQYATGIIIDSTNKSSFSNHTVFENVTIAAGTDFTFASQTTIKGVLYIKSPNKINFAGQLTVQGIIVCEGDVTEDNSADTLKFSGQVIVSSVETLPEEYGDLRQETGTFLLAPGFSADFSGQANFINGTIAANGISFSGQAGGVINGTIINYSHDTMVMSGQSVLNFDRTGSEQRSAGFLPYSQLEFLPETYQEFSL